LPISIRPPVFRQSGVGGKEVAVGVGGRGVGVGLEVALGAGVEVGIKIVNPAGLEVAAGAACAAGAGEDVQAAESRIEKAIKIWARRLLRRKERSSQ
jgi:hypothetical protein